MIFLRLYRFFSGKVKVVAIGEFTERILNLCAHNGITVWGIRKKNGQITFYMSARDFIYMRKVIRGNRTRLHILKKSGWPFIIRRYKHRYGLFSGVLFFVAVLWFLSGFVWNINVQGNDKIKEEEIKSALAEIGIYEGVAAKKIDAWTKRVELMTKIDGLAWTALNIEGCRLTVLVTEAETKNENDYAPCNLIASENGKITKIEVTDGEILVSRGDYVAKGELLVSGVYELSSGNTHILHSAGFVFAEVNQKFSLTVPLKQTVNHIIGSQKDRYALSFFGFKIPLYLGSAGETFLRNDRILSINSGDSYVPIYLHKGEFYEITRVPVTLSYERATEIAKERLNKKIEDAEIIKVEEKITQDETSVTVEYSVLLEKDIAKEEKILISATN